MRAAPLNATEQEKLRAAVAAAEANTSGEIVVALTSASPQRWFLPTIAAAMLALLLPGPLWWTGLLRGVAWLYAAQLLAFALLLPFFLWPPVARRLIPRSLQADAASEFAWQQFYAHGLHRTAQATGVMIFVSLAERHAEVLADTGIAAKVPESAWAAIVTALVEAIRQGRLADGLVAAVAHCGRLLAEHFPCEPEAPNQVPDRLVQL